MKELQYLNKYLTKYKWHLIWGLVFVVISNAFQILPAQFVRFSIDLVEDNVRVYRALDRSNAQADFFKVFATGILLYAVLILVMALLRGVFLYFQRQTLIVMSRLIEYDLKNEIFEHYQTLPISFYRRNNTGDLMNRISEDVGEGANVSWPIDHVWPYHDNTVCHDGSRHVCDQSETDFIFFVAAPVAFDSNILCQQYYRAPQ